MDNIYPNNINRTLFLSRDKERYLGLKNQAIQTCRNLISEIYIHSAFNKFKKGYLYKDDNEEIIGFCLWKENNIIFKSGNQTKNLHIILICTDDSINYKLGGKILFDVESYCIDNKIPSITLEAANDNLVKYYEKAGYILVNNSRQKREMEKEIKIIQIDKKDSKIRKIKKDIEIIPATI